MFFHATDELKKDKGKDLLIEDRHFITSAVAWWEHLAMTLRSIGFKGNRFDTNIWH